MLRLLVEAFVVVLVQSLTLLGILMQWLPTILRVAFDVVRIFMALCCLVYRSLLDWLAPPFRSLGINITSQPWRSLFAALLSLGSGAAVCAVAGFAISTWLLVGFVAHGLVVGFIWNQLALPAGQSIGR